MVRRGGLLLTIIGVTAPLSSAQPLAVPYTSKKLNIDSGVHQGVGSDFTTPFRDLVLERRAPWLRLRVSEYNLGRRSFVSFNSMLDGEVQRLDSRTLPQWTNATAIFNGDAVEVVLHVAPGEKDIFVKLDQMIFGDPAGTFGPPPADARSLCGADNRAATTDNRAGRLFFGGCTAWRITTGAFLTAGHCVDFDPQGAGLPDGVLDLSGVVEFNVPASTANGNTVAAAVVDQYPIDITPATDVVWFFDGVNSIGEDWAIFRVNANTVDGQLPHEAYGLPYRMTRENPANGDTMRVRGFGLDNTPAGTGGAGAACCTRDINNNCTNDCNAQHFTNQVSTGPYVTENFDNANDISHEYQVDTTGGNSGSPVIWDTNGLTVGIHTNAGCDASNGNQGTSFENDALETAIRNFVSTQAVFCDVGHPLRVAESGTVYRPFSTVTLGVANVTSGGIVSIVAGSYTAAAGNTFTAGADGKAMTLVAPVGTVVIGE